ncbi:MAG: N-formylglutamate amidohydrolase [Hyphomicrobiales bacterium]|nr:N-formylglutamate amidohydrolase [Hyphomicrobiales bacterium]MCP5000266.1 N-formylglutamate amidohydrolase [Hyphomicrobiales bacterium]
MEDSLSDHRPFEIRLPAEQTVPFVFNSPHSGRVYPDEFLSASRLDRHSIRRSEDYYVDQLFDAAPQIGAPLLAAHFPRAFIDVNREPYELDPRMFEGRVPSFINANSMRVAGGLGTIPRLVAENMEIYGQRMNMEDGLERIDRFYRPYHDRLRGLLVKTHSRFGYGVLVDCHSMPANAQTGSRERPDFVIGDRYGTSATEALSRLAVSILQDLGYTVSRNKPYAGGFITEHYGRPARGLHAMQIEINRGLYVNEQSFEKTGGFAALCSDLTHFMSLLTEYFSSNYSDVALAAE